MSYGSGWSTSQDIVLQNHNIVAGAPPEDRSYFMLSHVWGTTESVPFLMLNRTALNVKVTSRAKLRCVLKMAKQIRRDGPLWADFLSVNQGDDQALNHHVPRMLDYYKNASKVLVLLTGKDAKILHEFASSLMFVPLMKGNPKLLRLAVGLMYAQAMLIAMEGLPDYDSRLWTLQGKITRFQYETDGTLFTLSSEKRSAKELSYVCQGWFRGIRAVYGYDSLLRYVNRAFGFIRQVPEMARSHENIDHVADMLLATLFPQEHNRNRRTPLSKNTNILHYDEIRHRECYDVRDYIFAIYKWLPFPLSLRYTDDMTTTLLEVQAAAIREGYLPPGLGRMRGEDTHCQDPGSVLSAMVLLQWIMSSPRYLEEAISTAAGKATPIMKEQNVCRSDQCAKYHLALRSPVNFTILGTRRTTAIEALAVITLDPTDTPESRDPATPRLPRTPTQADLDIVIHAFLQSRFHPANPQRHDTLGVPWRRRPPVVQSVQGFKNIKTLLSWIGTFRAKVGDQLIQEPMYMAGIDSEEKLLNMPVTIITIQIPGGDSRRFYAFGVDFDEEKDVIVPFPTAYILTRVNPSAPIQSLSGSDGFGNGEGWIVKRPLLPSPSYNVYEKTTEEAGLYKDWSLLHCDCAA